MNKRGRQSKQRASYPLTTAEDEKYTDYRLRNNKAVQRWRQKTKQQQDEQQQVFETLKSENDRLKTENTELKIALKAIKSVFKVCTCSNN